MVSRTNTANATAVQVRTGKCFIKSVRIEQRAQAAPRLYLQIFNLNAPTVGTTVPEVVIPVPAGNANMDIMQLKTVFEGNLGGLYLSTGFAYAVTTVHDGAVAPTGGQEPSVEIHYENLG